MSKHGQTWSQTLSMVQIWQYVAEQWDDWNMTKTLFFLLIFFVYICERNLFYKETLLPANLMYYSCLVTTANDLTLFTVQFWLGDDVLVFLFSKWCIPWVIGYQYASHLSISLLPNCPGLNGQSCAWQSPSLPPALFWSVADFHVLLYLKMI